MKYKTRNSNSLFYRICSLKSPLGFCCLCALFLFLFSFRSSAQCPNDNTLWVDLTPPTCPGSNNTTCMFGGEYVTVSVTAGNTYTFQTCGDTDFDTEITLYNNSGGASIAYSDDDCSVQSSITWTATFTGVVRVLVDKFPCTDETSCMTLSVSCSPACANYNHPTTGLQNTYLGACMVSTCCANIYDDGGSGSNYSPNVNQIYRTFCPSQPGNCIQANFSSLSIEPQGGANCWDWLAVLNGPTQNSTMLWAGCDNLASPNTIAGTWGNPFTSTDPSGCLGFMFYSDGVGEQAGWAAAISCVSCGGGPSTTASTDCSNFNSICGNSPVTGSSTGPGLTSECSGCVVSENYSSWYSIYIGGSGTLTMTLNPVNNPDDYDFSIWGPNVNCANISSTAPIRCSYAANSGNTGIGNGAGDNSEDVTGDGWVANLPVTAGQTYILMVNNWSPGGSGFNIDWSGSTATLGTPPGSVTVQSNNTCPGLNQGSACAVINAGLPPYTYTWSTGASGVSCINNLSPGTYIVTVTDGSGCNSTSTGTVGNFGSPSPTASTTNTGCSGTCNGSATGSSTGGTGPYTYNWSTGGSGSSVSGLCEGSFSLTSTDANGCTGTTTFSISAGSTASTAASSASASPNPICSGSTTLSISGGTLGTGASWNWYSTSCGVAFAGSGSSISVSPSSTTTYYVRAEGSCNNTSCVSVTVTVNTPSTAPTGAAASVNPTCGGATTLTVSGGALGSGASWNWYSGSCGVGFIGTGSSISVSPSSSTTYYVLASGTCNTTGCASVTVNVNSQSTAPTGATASINPTCGEATTLTVSGGALGTGASWNWYPSSCGVGFVGSGSSISVSPSSSITYYVLASGTCNTTSCASVTVNVNSSSTAPSGATASVNPTCGGATTLTVSGGALGTSASWNWYSGSCGVGFVGTGSSISVSPSSSTTYYVLASGTCNTTSCASITINVNSPSTDPTGATASSNPTCGGATTLTVSGGSLGTGASWNWYSGSCGVGLVGSGPSISVSPSSATTYYVLASGTCNTTNCASVTINVNSPSTDPSGATASVNPTCGGSTTLSVSGGTLGTGASWNWYSSGCGVGFVSSGSSISITPSSTSTYYVLASGTCNTTNCASVTVTVNSNPDATITSAGPYCTGGAPVTLSAATSGGTWTGTGITNASTGTFDPSVSGAGSFTISYSVTSSGCTGTDTETITVNSSPDATITPVGALCPGDPAVTLSAATSGGIFNGPGVSGNTFDPSIAGAGTHTITYTVTSSGCTSTDTETITVSNSSDATINAVSPLCTGDAPVTLSAATGGGSWIGNGVSGNTFDPAAAGAGTHTITYTISGSCGSTDTESITVTANPNATINPVGALCPGDAPVTLSAATSGGTFSGTGVSGNTFDPAVSGPGSFTITYNVTSGGCSSADSETITVNANSDPTITAVSPLCTSDAPVTLSAATGGGTFSGNGVSGNTFDPAIAGAGTHTVTYTISGSCGSTDTETITVTANPDATITPVGALCPGDAPVTLSAATSGGTFSGTGVSGNTFDPAVSGPGSFTITYNVTSGGCSSADTETITVNANSDPTITAVSPLCTADAPVTLSAATGGGTFSGNGVSGNTFDPAIAGVGTHTVTYTISGSCGSTDTETITVTANPDATITPVGALCPGDAPVTLSAATSGGTFSGTGVSGNTFDPAVAGVGSHTITYVVTVNGCSGNDTETITVSNSTDPTINPVSPLCTGDAPASLTAATGGGVWSGTGVVGSSFNPSIAGPGSHTITYTISGSCGSSDTETITVSSTPDATINPVSSMCTSDAPVTLTAATGGGAFSGTGVIGNTFDPAISGTGTFSIIYNVTSSGCSSSDSIAITVNSNSDATITPQGPFCTGDAPVTLTAVSGGGLWTGNGVSGNSFDPALAGAGTHSITYEISGSCGDTDSVSITVNPSTDATINSASAGPFCSSDPPSNLSAVSGGGIWSGTGITNPGTGTFNPSVAGAGTHLITYTISGTCGSNDTIFIIVNNEADATITPIGPLCSADLPVPLNAAQGGGAWSGTGVSGSNFDPSVSGPGIFEITYSIGGACGNTDIDSVTVNLSSNATINAAGPYCDGDSPINLTSIDGGGTWSGQGITNSSFGTFDPAVAGIGNHTITYEISSICGDTGTIQIVVNANADATINTVLPMCTNDPPINLTSAQSGGTWTGSFGITNSSTGTFNPAVSGAGQQIVTYTISGTCGDTDTDTFTVNLSADATVNPAGPFCQTDPPVNLTSVQGGGTWGGNGITNVNSGTFNPAVAGSGTHTIMYIINSSCPDSSSISITVAPQIDANILSQGPYCNTDSAITLSATPTGGTWFGSGVLGNVLLPYVPSPGATYVDTIFYFLDTANCGKDADTAFITLINTPDATVNNPGPMCDTTAPVNLNPFVNEPGGTWGALVQSNGIFDPSTIPDSINPALVIYTNSIEMSGVTCTDVDSIYIFIGKVPPPPLTFSDTVCGDNVIPLIANDTSATGTGVLNWYYDSAGVIILADSNITSFIPSVSDSIADSVYVFYVQEQNENCPSAFSQVFLTVVNIGASFNTTPTDSGEIPLNMIFDNTSFGVDSIGDTYLWTFGDGDSSVLFNPLHIYKDTGIYTITLTVTDQFGVCVADTTYSIYAKGTSMAVPPNIFTPNGDGVNDVFNLIHKNLSVSEGIIYNRWGEMIFTWNSVEAGWDGRTISGTIAPDGVYYYMITATGKDRPEPETKTYTFQGSVTLVR